MILRAALLLTCVALSACVAQNGTAGYDVTPTGAKTVYVGHAGMLPFWVAYGPGGSTTLFTFEGVADAPPGVTAEVFCPQCAGTPPRLYNPGAVIDGAVRVSATRDAAPGTYAVKLLTRDQEGRSRVTALPLVIRAEPEPPSTPATYQPPIPTMAQWRQKMVAEGARFCNASNKNQTYAFGYEGSSWFYDGARVFYQIYDATGEDIWRECAENVATQYADYVNGTCYGTQCGRVPGWRVFPRGLRMAYERTGEAKYRTAVENLAANGLYTQKPGELIDSLIRETAYAADSLIEAKLIGSADFETVHAPKLRTVIDELLAMYEVLFESGTHVIHQPFYDALAAEALIDYYRFVGADPRIPAAIKRMLDWTWEVAWDQKAKGLAYQPDLVPWTNVTDILGLTVPAYAWYYSVTGDVTYLQRGDEMFAHVFDTPFWSGKQFTLTFRGTFEYVRWRSPASGEVGITIPERLYPSGRSEATIRLAAPAGGKCGEAVRFGGIPESLGWPRTVAFERGSDARTVRIRPQARTEPEKVTITAAYRSLCGQPATSGRAVTIWGPDHLAVVLSARRVPGGLLVNNRVVVNGPEPEEGAAIALTTDRPDLVRFYDLDGRQVSSVRVAGGKGRSEYFYLDTGYVAAATPVTVSASGGGLTGSATLTIDPPAPRVVVRNGTVLVGGFGSCFNQVVIDGPAPAGGVPVSIRTTDTKYLGESVQVTVPEGAISAFFCATPGMAPGGETVLHAVSEGGKYSRRSVLGGTRTLKITGAPATLRSGKAGGATLAFDGWIPGDAEVTLTSSDESVTVPERITIERSNENVTTAGKQFTIQAGVVTASKTVSIRAVSGTGHEATVTLTVTP